MEEPTKVKARAVPVQDTLFGEAPKPASTGSKVPAKLAAAIQKMGGYKHLLQVIEEAPDAPRKKMLGLIAGMGKMSESDVVEWIRGEIGRCDGQQDDRGDDDQEGDEEDFGRGGEMRKANPNHDDLGRFTTAMESAKNVVRGVIQKWKSKDFSGKASTFLPVDIRISAIASTIGLDIDGFGHSIDTYAIQHIMNHHGDAEQEKKRGQVPVTEDDLLLIPDVLSNPDAVRVGDLNRIGRKCISYVKHMPDDTQMVVQEVRTGRKQLSLQTMWKYPGTRDADALLRDPKLYAQDVTGDKPIVVHFGSSAKMHKAIPVHLPHKNRVEEDASGRLFYDHELMEVERADQLSSQWGESLSSNHPLLSARLNSYTVEPLAKPRFRG